MGLTRRGRQLGDGAAGEVAEGQAGAEGAPSRPVGLAGRRRDAVPGAEEPGYRRPARAQHPAPLVDHRTAAGVERPAAEQDGVVRAAGREGPHRRVLLLLTGTRDRAPRELDRRLAPGEVEIDTGLGEPVEARDGRLEGRREVGREPDAGADAARHTDAVAEPVEAFVDAGRELGEGVAPEHEGGFAAGLGDGIAVDVELVVVRDRGVPDHELHEVRVVAGLGREREVGLGPLLVDHLLVADAAPVLVDDDHAVAEGDEDVLVPGDHAVLDRRLERALRPERVAHVAELGTDRHGEVDEVARVGGHGAAAEDRAAQVAQSLFAIVR